MAIREERKEPAMLELLLAVWLAIEGHGDPIPD